jgi:hypothetical protein
MAVQRARASAFVACSDGGAPISHHPTWINDIESTHTAYTIDPPCGVACSSNRSFACSQRFRVQATGTTVRLRQHNARIMFRFTSADRCR